MFWLSWALAQRVRDPARRRAVGEPRFLTQLVIGLGLLIGAVVAAYDCYLASEALGRSRIIAVFFLTGVVPVFNALLAAAPFLALSEPVGSWLRPRPKDPHILRAPLTARSVLRRAAYAAGAIVATGVFLIGVKGGWDYFFQGDVSQGDWPRAFWVLLLVYGSGLLAGASYYPFHASARLLERGRSTA